MKSFSIAAALFGVVSKVNGHSWVECTEYEKEINGQDYDSSSCQGYPRNWATYNSGSFAADVGADYRPTGTDDWCSQPLTSDFESSYSDAYPMATYTAGSTVRVVWPAKNHANYECFSNIPDFSMKIYMNPNVNPSSDPSTIDDWELAYDWHSSTQGSTAIDGIPFSNCPSFCDDTGSAPCYGDMTLDESLFSGGSGYYTFMWYWAFNSETDIYSSCWEAYVDTNGVVTNIEDGDSTDDSSGDGGDSEDYEYLVQVPICYTGADYDESTVLQAATSVYSDVEWSVTSSVSGSDAFNCTLQTHTSDSPSGITSAANDNEFCDEIQSLYGDDGSHTCSSCTDVLVYTTNEFSKSTGGEGGSALVAVIIVLVIVVLIIGAGIGYQKMHESKKQGAQHSEHGMSTHIATQGQQPTHAIAPATHATR